MKVLVTGHRGLVGEATCNALISSGNVVITTDLDLRKEFKYISQKGLDEKLDAIIMCAAKVGGIVANNTYPVDFIQDNLLIELNTIKYAFKNNISKVIFLGSSCIYPKNCLQPMKEEYLLNGLLEPTNQPYALAKIAGIELCKSYNRQHGTNYVAAMPTNLYGDNDKYDEKNSHVIPAMFAKFYRAVVNNLDSITLFGTGSVFREFLHVDDLAKALVCILENLNVRDPNSNDFIVNIGFGSDLTINELAEKIKNISGFKGKIIWDPSYPDGAPKKLLDSSRITQLGWKPQISLDKGLKSSYGAYVKKCQK